MDLLKAYTGDGSDSDATEPAPARPASTLHTISQPATAEKPPQKQKIVTGTVELINLPHQDFDRMERRFDEAVASRARQTRPPVPKRPRTAKASSASDATPHQPRPSSDRPSPPAKRDKRAPAPLVPTTTFHLPAARDYQDRSWLAPPADARTFAEMETYTPYIPKAPVWQASAHAKGVSVARFIRPHGHLLLTAGLDGVAKVWRVDETRCARTYAGHAKGIRHAAFDAVGERFLTAGYDGRVLLWDTETGRVLASFRTKAVPYCVAFSPGNSREFLAGCGDKRVLQLDVRDANKVVQTYDQHMGAVNSLCFIDEGRRFVSSADDKVLRVWDYGVPVVIKYVTDPSAHSIPVTMLHPNQKSLVGQSMDNTVRVFAARDRFKRNDKKIFKGHLSAGYACGLTLSPDGRFVGSGDSMGRMFFWDWKTTRMFRALQAHDGVCIGLDWHPTRSSLVVSCGWDGQVKLWD